jgi:Uma2 family endonuclease
MAPASPRHGAIQAEAARLIGNHLAELHPACRVITAPGIRPKIRANLNVRVPGVAVSGSEWGPAEQVLPEPLAVIEILSPSPRADPLRRQENGTWPDNPVPLQRGDTLTLASIDFSAPLDAFYRTA